MTNEAALKTIKDKKIECILTVLISSRLTDSTLKGYINRLEGLGFIDSEDIYCPESKDDDINNHPKLRVKTIDLCLTSILEKVEKLPNNSLFNCKIITDDILRIERLNFLLKDNDNFHIRILDTQNPSVEILMSDVSDLLYNNCITGVPYDEYES